LVEQHFGLAMAVADVYVMNKGQIVFHDAPAVLKAESLKQKYLEI
jgi:ABC-type branched-subunit amino acid transport system ATPase component